MRQNDPPQGQKRTHSERSGSDALVAVHRHDAAANDFGAESGFVQGKAEDGGGECVELDAERRQRVIEEHELQELRRSPHEPDVKPGRAANDRVTRQTHQRQAKPERDAADHGERRNLQCEQCPFQKERLDDVGEKFLPRLQRRAFGGGTDHRRASGDQPLDADGTAPNGEQR